MAGLDGPNYPNFDPTRQQRLGEFCRGLDLASAEYLIPGTFYQAWIKNARQHYQHSGLIAGIIACRCMEPKEGRQAERNIVRRLRASASLPQLNDLVERIIGVRVEPLIDQHHWSVGYRKLGGLLVVSLIEARPLIVGRPSVSHPGTSEWSVWAGVSLQEDGGRVWDVLDLQTGDREWKTDEDLVETIVAPMEVPLRAFRIQDD